MSEQDKELIGYDDSLVSVKTKWGNDVPWYDDGIGPLWVCCNSLGVFGVIRAQDWDAAESIIRDEILKPIPEDEVLEAYGYTVSCSNGKWKGVYDWGGWADKTIFVIEADTKEEAEVLCKEHMNDGDAGLVEGYSYQDNFTGTGIVRHDLNGEQHHLLTLEGLSRYGLVIEAEDEDGNRYCVGKGDK